MLGNNLLKGERIYLDALQNADVASFGKWFANLDLLYNLWPRAVFPQTAEQEAAWLERARQDNNTYTFAVRLLKTAQLIGTVSLMSLDWRNRTSIFGISIADPEFWGKGYGSEATRVTLRYGFLELNLHRIELEVFSYNERAIRTYEKVGFKHEGTRRECLYRDGKYYDIHLMSILQHEWVNDVGE